MKIAGRVKAVPGVAAVGALEARGPTRFFQRGAALLVATIDLEKICEADALLKLDQATDHDGFPLVEKPCHISRLRQIAERPAQSG